MISYRSLLCIALALLPAALMPGCSKLGNPAANSIGSPQNPPLPRIESILPLEKDNHWVYTYMVYDTAGNALFDRYSLSLSISEAFGVLGDSLVPIWWSNYQDIYSEYVYAYKWEDEATGLLVAYRDRNVARQGVYVVGEYTGSSGTLYDTALLWLAYPASAGYTYTLNLDTSGDTANQSYMEVVSINEPYYFADSTAGQASALTFVKCYLYKEEYKDTTAYYWYNKDYGAVAYQQMYNGKKIKTYMLRAFRNDSYYYYY